MLDDEDVLTDRALQDRASNIRRDAEDDRHMPDSIRESQLREADRLERKAPQ